MGRRSDVVVYPIASKGARPEFLDELASLTGGRLHEIGSNDDLSATFRAILDEFRHRYLSPTRRRTCRKVDGTSSR